MTGSYSIITDGKDRHRLDFARRDFRLLNGPYFDAGSHFVKMLGIYDNFSVAGGIPEGARVTRRRGRIIRATQQLLVMVQRDVDLLQYDYKFSFSGRSTRPRTGLESNFHVRGLLGIINTRPHGYCYLNLYQIAVNGTSRLAEYIDMRIRDSIETDEMGTLRIHRKKAEVQWLSVLLPLLEFLRTRNVEELVIEHCD